MTKRIVVAGSRNYENYTEAKRYIEYYVKDIKKENTFVFVSGGCRGADMLGERYALENGYKIEHFPADWEKYSNAAGPMRNREMAKVADCVICFLDGKSKGTKSMIQFAKELNKPIRIKYIL